VALAARRFGGSPVRCRAFPLDLPFSVSRFLDLERPGLLALVETELWPGLLARAAHRGTPVLLVNGRLSERSAGWYRALRPLLGRALGAVTYVLARHEADAERFSRIGIARDRISVGGDMKLDRPLAAEPPFAEAFRHLGAGRPVVVAGSMAQEELPLVLDVRRRLVDGGFDPFLLLAPRRPESFDEVAASLARQGLSVARRSRPGSEASVRPDIYLLDSLGELAAAYRLGTAAVLGGTFAPKGGHNVLEALRAGLPVVHGPSVFGIRATLDAAAGAVFTAPDGASAAAVLARLLGEPGYRQSAASAATRLFEGSSGATRRAADKALELLR
jgi:3-deoxy-D-manno-octulosonic-acid transferase